MEPYSKDYLCLISDAEEAVRALLNASNPDSWMRLREGYGQIRVAVTRHEQATAQQQRASAAREADGKREERERRWAERDRRERAWRESPREYRERVLLDALGDERLTLTELAARMNRALSGPECRYRVVFATELRRLVFRMVRDGQLDCVKEAFKSAGRYRFWRRGGLDGPIAGLERAYHDDGEAVA